MSTCWRNRCWLGDGPNKVLFQLEAAEKCAPTRTRCFRSNDDLIEVVEERIGREFSFDLSDEMAQFQQKLFAALQVPGHYLTGKAEYIGPFRPRVDIPIADS
jgi:hypothetical protein